MNNKASSNDKKILKILIATVVTNLLTLLLQIVLLITKSVG